MNSQLLTNSEQLEPLLDTWRALACGNPFQQPEWLLTWWQHFQSPGDELFVLVVRDDEDRVRGIAPWYREHKTKTIRFLGDGSVCTDHASLLVDSQFHDESIPAIIASSLLEQWKKHPGWSAVQLESVDRCDSKMQMFEMAMKEHGSCVHHCQPANTWQVDLPDGWNAFLNGLSKNSRKMFRKRAQALDDMRVRWVYDRHDLAEFMPILIELHQKRRNALGDAGCFANRRFEAFLREAALRLLERNQLQAFTLWHGQRPIAADIGFRSQERWLCYQAGIDPEFLALEPGKLANVLILRDAERFGIKVVDFLRGDEPYKQQLKAQPKPFCTVRFSRPNLAGKADHWRWEVTAKTKRWIKTLRHRLTKPKASGSANPVNVPPPGESEV